MENLEHVAEYREEKKDDLKFYPPRAWRCWFGAWLQ